MRNRLFYGLILFFILAFVITWATSAIGVQALDGATDSLTITAALIAIYGPLLAALIVCLFQRDRLRIWGRSLIKWRVPLPYYAVALLYPLLLNVIAVLISAAVLGISPVFFQSSDIPDGGIVMLPVIFGAILLRAAIGEEPGWRGYALPELQRRFSPFTASLILGAIWAVWHFHPMNWPTLAPIAPLYALSVLVAAFTYTWLYNHTGSVLLCILFHAASNTAEYVAPTGVFGGSSMPLIISIVLNALTTALLVWRYGWAPRTLSPSDARRPL